MIRFAALICNTLTLIMLIGVIRLTLKRRNGWINMISFYCFCMLFFVSVPLWTDTFIMCFFSFKTLQELLCKHNTSGLVRYESILESTVIALSFYSLIFNGIVLATHEILNPTKAKPNGMNTPDDSQIFFRPQVYYLCSWLGLFFWGIRFGINFSNAGFGYRTLSNNHNTVLTIIASILFSASLPGLLIKNSNKLLNYIIICTPFAIIGYLTRSRALFIGVFCIMFYLVVNKLYNRKKKDTILIIIAAYMFVIFCLSIRTNRLVFVIYPLWRDLSFYDLHYSYENMQLLSLNGEGIVFLMKTGIPFVSHSIYEDITNLLAAARFYEGWGSLHPTLLGWGIVDYGWVSLLYGFFWGAVIAFSERIKAWMKKPFDMMYLGCQFIFVSILVRGSCQAAYAEFIYPTFAFFLINIFLSKFETKNNYLIIYQ